MGRIFLFTKVNGSLTRIVVMRLLLGNFNFHFARTKAPVIFAVRFARKGLKWKKSGGVWDSLG